MMVIAHSMKKTPDRKKKKVGKVRDPDNPLPGTVFQQRDDDVEETDEADSDQSLFIPLPPTCEEDEDDPIPGEHKVRDINVQDIYIVKILKSLTSKTGKK